MSKRSRKLRMKLIRGSSIMRVFGSSYKYKEEAKALRAGMRSGQSNRNKNKKSAPITTENSVRAISTPFGGMNKRY